MAGANAWTHDGTDFLAEAEAKGVVYSVEQAGHICHHLNNGIHALGLALHRDNHEIAERVLARLTIFSKTLEENARPKGKPQP